MENKSRKKAKLFNIKRLPMDIGRLICLSMPLFFRLKKVYVSEKAKQKLKGGALIASNHTCFVDPLILGCGFWYRRMFFLAAEVVMQHKLLRYPLKGIGCIEINRNICDMNAIRKSVSLLKDGHVMSVFPQGGIDKEDSVSAIKSGIVLMAMQAKVPVVPVYVYRKRKRGERNCLVIGEPIETFSGSKMPAMTDIQLCADTILEKMTECKNIFENMQEDTNDNN